MIYMDILVVVSGLGKISDLHGGCHPVKDKYLEIAFA